MAYLVDKYFFVLVNKITIWISYLVVMNVNVLDAKEFEFTMEKKKVEES